MQKENLISNLGSLLLSLFLFHRLHWTTNDFPSDYRSHVEIIAFACATQSKRLVSWEEMEQSLLRENSSYPSEKKITTSFSRTSSGEPELFFRPWSKEDSDLLKTSKKMRGRKGSSRDERR